MNCPMCGMINAEVLDRSEKEGTIGDTFASYCGQCGYDLRAYHGELKKYTNSRISQANMLMSYSTIYRGNLLYTVMILGLFANYAFLSSIHREYNFILTVLYICGLTYYLLSIIRLRIITKNDLLEVHGMFHTYRIKWTDIRAVRRFGKKKVQFDKRYEFVTTNNSIKINFNRFSPVCFHDVLKRIPNHCAEEILSEELADLAQMKIGQREALLKWLKPINLLKGLLSFVALGFFIDLISGFQFYTYAKKSISLWLGGYIVISTLCLIGMTILVWISSKDKLTDPLRRRVTNLAIFILCEALVVLLISRTVQFIGR